MGASANGVALGLLDADARSSISRFARATALPHRTASTAWATAVSTSALTTRAAAENYGHRHRRARRLTHSKDLSPPPSLSRGYVTLCARCGRRDAAERRAPDDRHGLATAGRRTSTATAARSRHGGRRPAPACSCARPGPSLGVPEVRVQRSGSTVAPNPSHGGWFARLRPRRGRGSLVLTDVRVASSNPRPRRAHGGSARRAFCPQTRSRPVCTRLRLELPAGAACPRASLRRSYSRGSRARRSSAGAANTPSHPLDPNPDA